MCTDKQKQDDLKLAKRAASGDNGAWRQIYDETCQPLFNFLCYQCGNRDVARDLLQETYIIALKRMDTYQGKGTLLSWLRTVALRKCLDWRRAIAQNLRKLTAFAHENAPPDAQNAQETFPGLGDGFEATLRRLSPRQRAALLLRELEELSFAEVAESLGCSEATARVHHHRACQNMRNWLENGNDLVFSGNTGGMS